MKTIAALSGKSRRRHMKFLRVAVYVRGEASFRMAERLHRQGLAVAVITKWDFFGGLRPFRELEMLPSMQEAVRSTRPILPGSPLR